MDYKTVYEYSGEIIHEEPGIINIPISTAIKLNNDKYHIYGFGLQVNMKIFIIYLKDVK
jgi:hypothetical protein